ncbi:putative glutathione S-transferase [Escherichia coli]|uniref:Putative glutathione S-transferase n=1 Tax=Escherichia coli TaxID=562 RepID=A0A376NWW1_ECOLX|nr:putative glutathione S-transferase [Escherichia coli]
MKLVGSYTSPFVRKLSILLLEKGITFEFINELPITRTTAWRNLTR